MKYKILICDDQPEHLDILERHIMNYFSTIEIKYICKRALLGEEAVKKSKQYVFDIAFLDIEMPDIKGIEISKQLKIINESILIVFVTSYSNYRKEAFDQFAFNYIDKPIVPDKFYRVINKALKKVNEERFWNVNTKVYNTTIKGGMVNIKYYDILYFEKKVNNIYIITIDNIYKIRKSFKKLEQEINMDYFIRCHKGFIINKSRIEYNAGNNIILHGTKNIIPIGITYKDKVLTKISEMIRERA